MVVHLRSFTQSTSFASQLTHARYHCLPHSSLFPKAPMLQSSNHHPQPKVRCLPGQPRTSTCTFPLFPSFISKPALSPLPLAWPWMLDSKMVASYRHPMNWSLCISTFSTPCRPWSISILQTWPPPHSFSFANSEARRRSSHTKSKVWTTSAADYLSLSRCYRSNMATYCYSYLSTAYYQCDWNALEVARILRFLALVKFRF